MHIRTFAGSDDEMDVAISAAEDNAQKLLDHVGPGELHSVTAQSFVDRWQFSGAIFHTCFHIITVVYE